MKQIQSGCIKTVLLNNGRLSHYVCSLPIPAEIAGTFLSNEVFSVKNRWFFTKTSQDWDALWYEINLVQVTVNDWKVKQYQAKLDIALNHCVNYKTK